MASCIMHSHKDRLNFSHGMCITNMHMHTNIKKEMKITMKTQLNKNINTNRKMARCRKNRSLSSITS